MIQTYFGGVEKCLQFYVNTKMDVDLTRFCFLFSLVLCMRKIK